MEMTIEEAYEILSNGLANAPSEHEWCVAFKMAIDTMRKYQKIEQIAERYEATKGATPKGPGAMMKDIIEIVKGEKE